VTKLGLRIQQAGDTYFALFSHVRLCSFTLRRGMLTTWVKGAASGWIEWRWQLTRKLNTLALTFGIGLGRSRQQGLGIGVLGMAKHSFAAALFNGFAKVHYQHLVGNMPNHT